MKYCFLLKQTQFIQTKNRNHQRPIRSSIPDKFYNRTKPILLTNKSKKKQEQMLKKKTKQIKGICVYFTYIYRK